MISKPKILLLLVLSVGIATVLYLRLCVHTWMTRADDPKHLHLEYHYVTHKRGGNFKLAAYYSDHMVLQMEPSGAVIWGYADLNANITLLFNDAVYRTEAQAATYTSNGVWRITLDPQPPSGPFTISITSDSRGVKESVDLQDVLFGDVWVCSGQSNMGMSVEQAFNGSEALEQSYQYSNIRVLSIYQNSSKVPLYDIARFYKPWSRPDPDVLGKGYAGFFYFSAVCWFYGRDLYNHLKYPIGLISSNWGKTPIESWSSPPVLGKCGIGINKPSLNAIRLQTLGLVFDDSGLWNAMIHPMINMTIKGAIWYQGEANTVDPGPYKCLFQAMIEDWRDRWYEGTGKQTDPTFPFGFVQLSTSQYPEIEPLANYTAIRWHQTYDYGYAPNPRLQNVFMAVTVDLLDLYSPYGSIHPRYKDDVADRLVLGARSVAYGEGNVIYQGPFPTTVIRIASTELLVEFDDGRAALSMKNSGGFDVCCSLSPTDCPLVGSGLPWIPVKSAYQLGKSRISMRDPCVARGQRASVLRYNWYDMPCESYKQCPLYGANSNLPVPPFIKALEDEPGIRPPGT